MRSGRNVWVRGYHWALEFLCFRGFYCGHQSLAFWDVLPNIPAGEPLLGDTLMRRGLLLVFLVFRLQYLCGDPVRISAGRLASSEGFLFGGLVDFILSRVGGGHSGMELQTVGGILPNVLTRESVLKQVGALLEALHSGNRLLVLGRVFGEQRLILLDVLERRVCILALVP